VVREHSGRVLAALTGQFRDLGLAEDSLQEAWLLAAERWPVDGWPANPAGWAYTVARRRALDRVARESSRAARHQAAHALQLAHELDEMEHREDRWRSGIDDDRLRLIFVCCHPLLDVESQIALTLRSVAWLSTDEIATAFGVPTATMAQRLVRAKARIKAAGIPYRVPGGAELPDRLLGVLRVLYLVFNESYLSARSDGPIRVDLADEAIRLARLLVELMPDEPEAAGLLALMLAQHSRRHARFDARGDLVTLEHQHRALWDAAMAAEAERVIVGAMRRRTIGRYQVQAAIASLHNEAPTWASTDWRQMASLYGVLLTVEPTPVVELNRAVAIGFADGFEAGLVALDAIDATRVPQPHLLPAARAEMLLRSGDREAAAAEFERAIELVTSPTERAHLERRHLLARSGHDTT
jgi:RNA polymerase sigma-70 factor (ECF subfamily)